jgi:dCMP deaminase|tara:strand:+ start:81 stop:482 length:402 start_codon:yes stop_codon:yes gene_type:complete
MNKWNEAHMRTAENYASLSSAQRLKVGCVIVKDNRIISIGYNGMPSGWDNVCETDGKTKDEVLHAEANAITKVAMSSESCYNGDIYTTTAPCLECAKLIYQSGISKVFYRTPHLRSEDGIKFLDKCDINVIQL